MRRQPEDRSCQDQGKSLKGPTLLAGKTITPHAIPSLWPPPHPGPLPCPNAHSFGRETVIPLTTLDRDSRHSGPSKGRPSPTPWARMMASPAVWAIVVNNFSFHYAFYVVMNWLPTYFNQ